MAALGMIVQRSDVVVDFFKGTPTTAVEDSYTLAAGERHLLDVLANDTAVPEGARPVAVVGPDCGTVRTSGRRLLYVGDACAGRQTLSYRIDVAPSSPSAVVEIALTGPEAKPDSADEPESTDKPVAAAEPGEPAVPRLDAGSIGMAAPAAPSEGTRIGGTDLGIDDPDGGASARGGPAAPGALAVAEQAPDSVTAPEAVGAPRTGAAPREIAQAAPSSGDAAISAPAPAPRRAAVDEDIPDGLFGTRERAFTQAAPDPSRPDPAVPLDNLLAYAPAPAPAAPGGIARRAGAPEARLREIANMPEGFAASPQALSAPMVAAAQDRPSRSLSLVRVGSRTGRGSAPSALAGQQGDAGSGFDAQIPRANPVRISRSQNTLAALADPSSGLGDALRIGQTGSLGPVTVGQPTGLSAPSARDASILAMQGDASADIPEEEETAELAALTSPIPRRRGGTTDAVATAEPRAEERPEAEPAPEPKVFAALPDARAVCAVEPAINVDPRPAGRTVLRVASPCHAGSIAELRHSDLRLAIPLDGEGRGEVEVLGFASRSSAVLWFRDGREIAFDLPFIGMRNLTRVALAWDAPVVLDLHAFEFGADAGGEGHVHPGNRRSFDDIRRRGGGFLTTYSSISGIGQNMQVYSFWQRRSNRAGVVDLAIDYATRSHERRPDTCGGGPYAAPAFVVVRSHGGEMGRVLNRRLSAMECGQLAGRRVLIEAAVDDVIIRGR